MCCTAKHKGHCAKEGGAAKGSSTADKDLAARKDDVSTASGADSGGRTIDEGSSNLMACRPMRNAEALTLTEVMPMCIMLAVHACISMCACVMGQRLTRALLPHHARVVPRNVMCSHPGNDNVPTNEAAAQSP